MDSRSGVKVYVEHGPTLPPGLPLSHGQLLIFLASILLLSFPMCLRLQQFHFSLDNRKGKSSDGTIIRADDVA